MSNQEITKTLKEVQNLLEEIKETEQEHMRNIMERYKYNEERNINDDDIDIIIDYLYETKQYETVLQKAKKHAKQHT